MNTRTTIEQTTISIGDICELANAVVEDFRNNLLHFGKPEDASVVSCALGNFVGRIIDKGMQLHWQNRNGSELAGTNGSSKIETELIPKLAALRFRCPTKKVFAKLSSAGTCSACRGKHVAA